ncbi:hypothetical protein C0Z20_16990 [Trinickia symbiotica]|uniref:Uncharacterized protein n=1 Tax=Trinickia symbiotica TaxID=863227 RepID=A0A2N7X289_9BURK|nr:hypothetical protein C0Z20_16990 [Trinickia symbiotica]
MHVYLELIGFLAPRPPAGALFILTAGIAVPSLRALAASRYRGDLARADSVLPLKRDRVHQRPAIKRR